MTVIRLVIESFFSRSAAFTMNLTGDASPPISPTGKDKQDAKESKQNEGESKDKAFTAVSTLPWTPKPAEQDTASLFASLIVQKVLPLIGKSSDGVSLFAWCCTFLNTAGT